MKQLKRHPYLEQLGLVVNTELSKLCCESCGYICKEEEVPTHMKKKHPEANITVDASMLNSVCKKMNVQSYPPPVLPLIRDEYDGIHIYDGIACRDCEFACRSEQYMQEHHRKTHPKVPMSCKWPKVKVQRLSPGSGPGRSYFQIRPRAAAKPTDDEVFVQDLFGEIHCLDEEDEQEAEKVNARLVSPWLLSTGWHEHVSGHNIAELKALVAHPKRDEFPELAETVIHLLKGGEELIDEMSELILQRLNSPYPDKE